MEAIMAIAKEHNLYVIEDNAQAIANCKFSTGIQKKAGTIGHVGSTSSLPKKFRLLWGWRSYFTNDDALAHKTAES
jgi:dTDP-4-amino-4,6-dideoxygalactose transaminase